MEAGKRAWEDEEEEEAKKEAEEEEEKEALRAMSLRRLCARAPPDPMDAEFCIHGHHYP